MKRPTAQSSHASYRNASREGIGRRALRAEALASMVPALLLGCAWTPVRPYEGGAAPVSRGDVIAAAWHTEIGVAAADIDGPLTVLVSDFPGARELVLRRCAFWRYRLARIGLYERPICLASSSA
jgi:hypothetical protein